MLELYLESVGVGIGKIILANNTCMTSYFIILICDKLVNECSTQKYNYSRLYNNHVVMKQVTVYITSEFFNNL